MAEFFAELKRRQMFRVAAAYAVIAWLLLQLINNLTPALRLPEWAATLVVVLLVSGFPIALLFCWIQHLPSADGSGPSGKTRKQDWLLIGALALVLLFMGYQQIAPSSDETTAQTGVDAAREAAASPRSAISIAVLPFANLSGDANQEFFSDGMTEEITGALARVPDLRVVARTSAFEFKGQNRNIQTIGQQLKATHLIEGSVRKAGERVRITAQLINAADGTHLWSENYDRELSDIFAIQEDIARAIATSLRMPLGLKAGENLVNNRSLDPGSYQEFLRARALVQARGASLREAALLLEGIVARHPDFAPAWLLLSSAYDVIPNFSPERNGSAEEFRRVVDLYLPKAEAAARRALQLDPSLAAAYGQFAVIQYQRGKPLEAEESFLKALDQDPASEQMYGRTLMLAAVGRLTDSLALRKQLQTIEPFVPLFNVSFADALWLDGQNDAAIAHLKAVSGVQGARTLAMIYASMGSYDEAADALMATPSTETVVQAMRLLRTAPAKTDNPQTLPALGSQYAWVYLAVGAESRVLDNYETLLGGGRLPGQEMGWLWHPSYAPVRKTERFKAFARKAGFVDYWRAKGWPDQCRATTGDDFVCD